MFLSRSNYLIFALVTILSSACQQNRAVVSQGYFNIDSLIQANVAYFTEAKHVLKKYASVNGKSDTTVVTLSDSAGWAEELGIFYLIGSINNPVNRGNYAFEDKLKDSQSNLISYQYTAVTDLPLRFLKIYYHKSLPQIRKIEALYKEKNALYTSSKYLTIKMQPAYNKTVVTSYSLTGSQKMILGDSVNFQLYATIDFN